MRGPQTNRRNRKEETQTVTRQQNTIKVIQPAILSSAS